MAKGLLMQMNYNKHMGVFLGLGLAGFILYWFAPDIGAVIFLPALGAYFGARKAQKDGPAQPSLKLWGIFFGLVAIGVVIRFLVPESNFGGFGAQSENFVLFAGYQLVLVLTFSLFGYLAYLQRVGRTSGK
jgi:hypothetical protein